MNNKKFFKEFIELVPQRLQSYDKNKIEIYWSEFVNKERVDEVEKNAQNEVERFAAYMWERDPKDRVNILEYVTDELLTAYYNTRLAMKGLSNKERDKGRPAMFAIYEVIVLLLVYSERFLKLKCTDEFISHWAKRTDYLPFFDEHKQDKEFENEMQKPQSPVLPPELNTPEAKAIFDKAIIAGFINKDYSFNGTKYQMAYFAERMSESLQLKHKWRPFIDLWGYKYFPQTRRESVERFGYVDKQDEIDAIIS